MSPSTACCPLRRDTLRQATQAVLANLSKQTTPSRTPADLNTSSLWEKVFAPLPSLYTYSAHAKTMLGTYVLRDDLHLATPPPHPSEAPIHNPNPLATTISPPSTGTKLSLVVVAPRQQSYSRLTRLDTTTSTRSQLPASIQESPNESNSQASDSGSHSVNGIAASPREGLNNPPFGSGNAALAALNGKDSKDPSKRRKPKSNIVKSNSSFVSRVIPHEALTKRLQEHNQNGLYALANINRALQWLDLSSPTKVRDVLGGHTMVDLTIM